MGYTPDTQFVLPFPDNKTLTETIKETGIYTTSEPIIRIPIPKSYGIHQPFSDENLVEAIQCTGDSNLFCHPYFWRESGLVNINPLTAFRRDIQEREKILLQQYTCLDHFPSLEEIFTALERDKAILGTFDKIKAIKHIEDWAKGSPILSDVGRAIFKAGAKDVKIPTVTDNIFKNRDLIELFEFLEYRLYIASVMLDDLFKSLHLFSETERLSYLKKTATPKFLPRADKAYTFAREIADDALASLFYDEPYALTFGEDLAVPAA